MARPPRAGPPGIVHIKPDGSPSLALKSACRSARIYCCHLNCFARIEKRDTALGSRVEKATEPARQATTAQALQKREDSWPVTSLVAQDSSLPALSADSNSSAKGWSDPRAWQGRRQHLRRIFCVSC